jgi:hypothetical protein
VNSSHEDFFIRNLIAIRGEAREVLAIYKPKAFAKMTGPVTPP